MKDTYFTQDNIKSKSQEMVGFLKRRPFPEKVNGKMALLVLDMQDYFLQPESHAYVPSANAVIDNINKLSEVFEKKNWPIFCTQHINVPGEAGMMEEWWDDLLTEEHPHKNLIDEIKDHDCTVIKKSQYDAFYQTDLLEELQSRDITDVVITGVMTHLCCETTARSAFVNGFRVWFMVDVTATYKQEYHMSSIWNLNHGFAYPLLTDELLGIINK